MINRLNKYSYEGPLMLEVFRKVRPDYMAMLNEAFIHTCYERIKRISEL